MFALVAAIWMVGTWLHDNTPNIKYQNNDRIELVQEVY